MRIGASRKSGHRIASRVARVWDRWWLFTLLPVLGGGKAWLQDTTGEPFVAIRGALWGAGLGLLFVVVRWLANGPGSTSESRGGSSPNRRIPMWVLWMAIPLQYLWIVGSFIAGSAPGQFGCTNFHSDGLSPCSFGEMLVNALIGLLLANVVSLGIPTFMTAGILVLVLLAYRRITGEKGSARPNRSVSN